MNKIILAVIAVLISAASAHSSAEIELLQPSMQVDSTDTVYFDLAHLDIQGSKAIFPVFIASDDTIFSLDYSFKYDMDSVQYDSIIELTSYIQSFYYFNTNDSTLRYTSYSIQPYDMNMGLMNVQFDLTQQTTFFDNDLYELLGYLNGTQCSVKITSPTSGINDVKNELPLAIYPNPASSTIYIHTQEGVTISILSSSGQTISETKAAHLLNPINTESLIPGIYLVKVTDGTSSAMQKLIKL